MVSATARCRCSRLPFADGHAQSQRYGCRHNFGFNLELLMILTKKRSVLCGNCGPFKMRGGAFARAVAAMEPAVFCAERNRMAVECRMPT